MTQVIDLPLQHCNTLNTHSKCESGVFLAVNAGGFKHIRIHHSAAENLQPAGSLADVATLAVADVATYVHLGGRLGEREV